MELTRKTDEYRIDTHPHSYIFTDNSNKVTFFQSGNMDLNFWCISKEKEFELIIDESENYGLYQLFKNLYTNLLYNYKEKYGYDELFQNGYIYLQSDAPANEYSMDEFIYNYFKIDIDNENRYHMTFINNTDQVSFVVELNTDRSRYGILVYEFFKLLKGLEELTEEYHQITIDEYLYQKKLTKNNNPS